MLKCISNIFRYSTDIILTYIRARWKKVSTCSQLFSKIILNEKLIKYEIKKNIKVIHLLKHQLHYLTAQKMR